jgi:hypothetical protein
VLCRWSLRLRVDSVVTFVTEGMARMGYREVAVEEIKEVLRLWLGLVAGLPRPGLRTIARHAGVDRKKDGAVLC